MAFPLFLQLCLHSPWAKIGKKYMISITTLWPQNDKIYFWGPVILYNSNFLYVTMSVCHSILVTKSIASQFLYRSVLKMSRNIIYYDKIPNIISHNSKLLSLLIFILKISNFQEFSVIHCFKLFKFSLQVTMRIR